MQARGARSASEPRPSAPAADTPPNPPAKAAGDVAYVDVASLLARPRDAHARGIVINAWASWCGSCREEIPLLLQLQAGFAPEGLQFAFVTVDQPAELARAAELMKSWGGPLPVLAVRGSLGDFKRAMTAKWRGAIPATFLFDAQGQLRHYWEGPILEEEIAPLLQRFLAGENVDGETRTTGAP